MQFVGTWNFEHECVMGPDQPPMKSSGTQSIKALGSLWTLGEMDGPGPDGTPVRSLITLGYDPARKCFVGSFIASCMTHLWPYTGRLDDSLRVLELDSEGPSFTGDGYAKYKDIIEIVDENHYKMRSRFLGPDGTWTEFMQGLYTRSSV